MASKIKISDLSKDFSLKSKDVVELFREKGIEKASSSVAVSDEDFEIFMQHITSTHQIKDIDAYTEGKVTVSAVKEKTEKTESKTEAKPAHMEEEKPISKTEEKPAHKEEEKPISKTEEKPAQKLPEAKAPAQNASRPQQRYESGTQQARPRDSFQKGQSNFERRDNRQGQQGGHQRDYNYNVQNRQGGYERRDNRQGQQGGYRNNYSAVPNDPFAKRREDMNRAAEGYRKPGKTSVPQQQKKPEVPEMLKTVRETQGQLPAQQQALEKKQKQQAAQRTEAARKTEQMPKKEEKRAKKQQLKTITPTFDISNVRGGVNIGAEYASNSGVGKRVIDTRGGDVDLSKYDERYNDQYYAILNGTDNKSSKTKLKKQDHRGQNSKSAKDKERAAQERIKKLEAERARNKQLEITVPDEITVSELASRLKKTAAEVIKKLMLMGEMKGLNDVVDYATAEIIGDEFGAKVTREIVVTIEEKLFTEAEDNDEDLVERAPVVCVMGHVDHGKTSILDAIRHTNVTKGEAGGITQAIGAYRVKANDKDITFLDTPGHEAFTAMRLRGAKSTDIAILVVAADDGVMPQTVEAISHAKSAGIDIIVAINKMDKPQANPDNVLNQLTQYELVPEAWGGDVITVPVSALTGMGIDDLLESVLLVAEVKELKANPHKRARGIVIESKLDRGRGPVATVLVQNGTLHLGDYIIVGNAVGRVRAMVDDKGKTVKTAGPSVPVEIIGLDEVPQAGDELNAVEDERMARSLAEQRREKQRADILAANARVNLDDLFSRIAEGVKTLNIIVKADVAGSAEAVKASLLKLSTEEVKVNVIHSAVGGITESDVMLAATSGAIIVGFNVRPDKNALDSAERNEVDIRTHRIIYEIIDEVEAAMKGMLAPTYREVLLGHAAVRQTIKVPGVGIIAGCYVQDGKITRQSSIRIVRDGVVIFEDKISSLRRFKDDVKEVNDGYECGVGIEKFNDIREGDILEAFIMEEVAR